MTNSLYLSFFLALPSVSLWQPMDKKGRKLRLWRKIKEYFKPFSADLTRDTAFGKLNIERSRDVNFCPN